MRPALLGEAALAELVDRVLASVRPTRTVLGWATIDLDRLAPPEPPDELAADDLLGAAARRIDAGRIALEPTTEGRLAASLARYGEGPVALYLLGGATPQPPDVPLSVERGGPFGPQRLVLGSPRWGPHLIVVASPVRAATIWP